MTKSPDFEFILAKARHYCSFQERCIGDVTTKLHEWKVNEKFLDKIIESLIKDDYLNEERFARLFAGGKFRINHWGKTKIIYELGKRKIPELIIQIGLQEIDDEEYENRLKDLMKKKSRELHEPDRWKRKQKLIAFAVQRGFHYSLAKQVVEEMEAENR